MPKNKPQIIVIVGPTASGKSDLAVRLALRLRSGQAKKKYDINGAEIISADSRQVYKGMDTGTGKITGKEMRGIPHHLLDIASPRRQFTVAQYQKLGQRAIKKILAKKKLPIIVGGTGFYIDALVNDIALPEVKPNTSLRKKFDKLTTEKLFKILQKLDLTRAKSIDCHNKRRLIRALEIIKTTGKPIPKPVSNSQYGVLSIGIKIPNEKLKKIIKTRLIMRFRQGMIAEVQKLHNRGVSWKKLDNFGLEYRWVSRYLRGLISKQEMVTKLETEIWHYAKRQITWFKRDKNIHWVNKKDQANKLLREFLREN